MKLVVGLGNPGRQYVGTRHNIGFEAVDRVAAKIGAAREHEFERVARNRFDALALEGTSSGEKVLLLMPLTFMNLSGKSVQEAMAYYHLGTDALMVLLDDLALPCGKIRLRAGGSSGGHNGLRDIERALATTQYPRLRIGIDPAPPPMQGRDYVLGRFTEAQRVAIEPAIDRAASAVLAWIEKDIETAMNRYNGNDEQ